LKKEEFRHRRESMEDTLGTPVVDIMTAEGVQTVVEQVMRIFAVEECEIPEGNAAFV
jgi:uncharacterized protein YbcI